MVTLKKIKAKLTELPGWELTAIPLDAIVGNVNRSLRSWAELFPLSELKRGDG